MRGWVIPKVWKNSTVYVIGGGPSINRVFDIPKQVEHAVRNQESSLQTYAPYMTALHDKHVVGVNVAYELGGWVDFCFFGDQQFGVRNLHGLSKYPGIAVTIRELFHTPTYRKWGIRYSPKSGQSVGINAERICWNGNSGTAAINLAYLLGARRVVLIGFDMDVLQGNQHFHNHYRKEAAADNLPFVRYLKNMERVKKDAHRLGLEIINTSMNSAITCFDKKPLFEVL